MPEHQWLTGSELATWRALNLTLSRLPWSLDRQLQNDAGLSFMEYYVLAILADAEDRTARMSTVASLVNGELSRVSHLAKRLETRGLVVREPDPTNRRFTNVVLTSAGYELLQRAAPAHVALVRRLVFAPLSPEDVTALRRIADAINDAADEFDQHRPGTPGSLT